MSKYKHLAKVYSLAEYNGTGFLAYRDLPSIIDKYITTNSANVLDYGCGTGDSTRILTQLHNFNIIGVDIDSEMLSYARQKDDTSLYHHIESAKVPYNDLYFDLITSCLVMVEISTKKELHMVFSELNRILKEDGIFILVTVSKFLYQNKWLTIDTDFIENRSLHSGQKVKVVLTDIDLTIFDYFWTEDDYQEIITSTHFTILDKIYTYGQDSDGYNWISEKHTPPFLIYVLQKS